VTKRKSLEVLSPKAEKLGRATIMDRALAQKHGTAYVMLSAFAIDLDRVRELDPDDETLPFGWEVALTDAYLTKLFAPVQQGRVAGILEDVALHILELPRPSDDVPAALGSQLSFAIFTATQRGELPDALFGCFRAWKKPPLDLAHDVAAMLAEPEQMKRAIAYCKNAAVSPPLVDPVVKALDHLALEFSEA
jgi:hypothetical protein